MVSTRIDEKWINDDIKLDFKIPRILFEDIDLLERLDSEKDYYYFDVIDNLDMTCKQLWLNGSLKKEDWEKIMKRYDWRVQYQEDF